MPTITPDEDIGIAFDMHGCPNRCRHRQYRSGGILDTWPCFEETVACQMHTVDEFLTAWHDRYLSKWPSLRRMCLQDYAQQGESWRELGAKWLYPVARDRQSDMGRARRNLLATIPKIDASYRAVLGSRAAVRYVILVDMGFAGWAARYRGGRAVLLGLTQIVRLGWHHSAALADLVAHELGHHAHQIWRGQSRLGERMEGPFARLYREGFAQRFGQVLGGKGWHQASGEWRGWLRRCRQVLPSLAREFLEAANKEGDVRRFFGDWLEVRGLSMTGYFMGHGLVVSLENDGMSLKEIARLSEEAVSERAEAYLRLISGRA